MRPQRRRRFAASRSRGIWGRFAPRSESLESRELLSTASVTNLSTLAAIVVQPASSWSGNGGGNATPPSTTPSGYSPAQVNSAYGFNSLNTTTGKENGAGETIAIVDAYGDSSIASDLAAYDKEYDLPTANLVVVNQNGSATSLPSTNTSWSLETSLDVEWAHAVAPGATIVLVEANSSSLSDLLTAVQTAANGVAVNGVTYSPSVVSMSWGTNEFSGETQYDSIFSKTGVTFVSSSGDTGGATGASWPAVSPNVVSVGGTSLSVTSSGTGSSTTYAYGGETAWSLSGNSFTGESGSGGGVSQLESTPSYQSGLGYSGRATPDVSYDASPSTGYAVYDSLEGGWVEVGGTSAGAPQWAGLVAIADQGRAAAGLPTLSSSSTATSQNNILDLLYATYRNGSSSTYASAFHDVTSGSNAAGTAKTGYDLVTGLGSPNASILVPYLVNPQAAVTTTSTTTTATPTQTSGSSTTSTGSSTPTAPPSNPHGPDHRFFPRSSSTGTSSGSASSSSDNSSTTISPTANGATNFAIVVTLGASTPPAQSVSATAGNAATAQSTFTTIPTTTPGRGQSLLNSPLDGPSRLLSSDSTGLRDRGPTWRDLFGPMFESIEKPLEPGNGPVEEVHQAAIASLSPFPNGRSPVVNVQVPLPDFETGGASDSLDDGLLTRLSPMWAAGVAALLGAAWGLHSGINKAPFTVRSTAFRVEEEAPRS